MSNKYRSILFILYFLSNDFSCKSRSCSSFTTAECCYDDYYRLITPRYAYCTGRENFLFFLTKLSFFHFYGGKCEFNTNSVSVSLFFLLICHPNFKLTAILKYRCGVLQYPITSGWVKHHPHLSKYPYKINHCICLVRTLEYIIQQKNVYNFQCGLT